MRDINEQNTNNNGMAPMVKIIEICITHDLDFVLSNANLSVDSAIESVKKGYNIIIVVFIRSIMPYSSVSKTLVYNGVNKKTRIFKN